MAAIEALIEFLGHSQVKTVYETIDLVKKQSDKLEAAVTNPIALSHGAYLFQQYLYSALKNPSPEGKESASFSSYENFEVMRQHLLRNGRVFAERAKDAREAIAVNGRRQIYDGTTILTHGGSRVVGTLLGRAAEKHDFGHYVDDPRRFKVIYAVDAALEAESNKVIAALRAKGVQVATIPFSAVSYAMAMVDIVIVGAEAVTAAGGIISRLGTFQVAQLAKANKKPFFVAAEQHKFGKTFPLGQFDYSFDQAIIDFHASKAQDDGKPRKAPMENPVDHTVCAVLQILLPSRQKTALLTFVKLKPPEYIEAFFADHKLLTPSEVAKEVIDMLM